MTQPKTFLVKYHTTEQVSEDQWDRIPKELIVDENTTIEQIWAWYESEKNGSHKSQIILSMPKHLNL
jgi:hypothetical protein